MIYKQNFVALSSTRYQSLLGSPRPDFKEYGGPASQVRPFQFPAIFVTVYPSLFLMKYMRSEDNNAGWKAFYQIYVIGQGVKHKTR